MDKNAVVDRGSFADIDPVWTKVTEVKALLESSRQQQDTANKNHPMEKLLQSFRPVLCLDHLGSPPVGLSPFGLFGP